MVILTANADYWNRHNGSSG